MGYYTNYTLSWSILKKQLRNSCEHDKPENAQYCPDCGKPVSMVSVSSFISKYIVEHDEIYGIDEDGEMTDSVKWYGHENHMKQMSIEFPDVLFTLHGEGEESSDIWNKYFLNGKMQNAQAKIVIPEFDAELPK